jgi:hypothetical protein
MRLQKAITQNAQSSLKLPKEESQTAELSRDSHVPSVYRAFSSQHSQCLSHAHQHRCKRGDDQSSAILKCTRKQGQTRCFTSFPTREERARQHTRLPKDLIPLVAVHGLVSAAYDLSPARNQSDLHRNVDKDGGYRDPVLMLLVEFNQDLFIKLGGLRYQICSF